MYNAVNMLILTTATHCSQLVTFWLDFCVLSCWRINTYKK